MTNRLFISALFYLLCCFSARSQNLEFIENKGQWDPQVKFMAKVEAGAFFIHQNGFTVLQHDTADWSHMAAMYGGAHGRHNHQEARKGGTGPESTVVKSHAYRVAFSGANESPQILPDRALPTYNNYFIGNDPSKWASNCKIYGGITVKNVYPNVDVRYYAGQGSLKYDIIVHPGGDVSRIALNYDGADGLSIRNKELIVKTSVGELKERSPYTYQYNEAGRLTLDAKYEVKGSEVRFNVKGYNPKTTLVIDPDLVFASYSRSTSENWGFTATYGPDGSMFGGGIVFAPAGFPTSPGAFQETFQGGVGGGNGPIDIGIIKLSPDGTQRIYATYIGGDGNEFPHSLIVTPQNELIVAGRTTSGTDYPTRGQGLFGPGGGFDIVVTKLTAAGNDFVGSMRIGGTGSDGANINDYNGSSANSLVQNYGDDSRSEVNIDGAGNIYLASCTRSTGSNDDERFFRRNAVQNTPGGAQDGVLIKINPSVSDIFFSTYLGGSGNDAAYVVSLHPTNGNIYVAGGTASTNPSATLMPGPRAGTVGPNPMGGTIDGFVSVLTPDGSSIIRTTYIGTPIPNGSIDNVDQVYGIQFDQNGFPYIMGQTRGIWQPVNAAWSQANGKQFIAKLQPDLSAYVYSTCFGKGQAAPDISPVAFLVDRCENVYISGWGGRWVTGFPNAGVLGLPVTPDAIKPNADPGNSGVGDDFYFFVLKKDAVSQLYGSFYGQNNVEVGDHVDGGTSRFDKNGIIYQAICAGCGNSLPMPGAANNAWARLKPGNPPGTQCNLGMVKIAFNFAGTNGDVRPSINGVPRDSTGCVPLTVDFTDTIQDAPGYEWNFGDGSPQISTTSPTVSHTYNNVGSYLVMMVAVDSTKCFPRDTSYVTVKVGDNQAIPTFRAVKLSPPCDTFRYRFDNTTVAPAGIPFKATTFTWDFGDGSLRVTTDGRPVFHTYANTGTYNVLLFLNDTSYCNSPDTARGQVRVAAVVQAVFNTPARGCAPYRASFQNESIGGAEFTWDFGDGSAPERNDSATVTHFYTSPGTYIVTLTAIDSNTCNIIDTAQFRIVLAQAPSAFFTAAPQPPSLNTPVSYTNLSSSDAIRFKWLWGDGDSLLTISRALVQHEFNTSGTYTTCLTAYNTSGCENIYCARVASISEPAVDVPNAFTPQSGDVNSKVFVRGFDIAKLKFVVYARWGEKVFETADKRVGWDGRYKGQLLPMDAYAYTLDVEFNDGKKYRKTGDITLIR